MRRHSSPPGRLRRRSESGGTVVEFAIVLPLFFAILFGCVDYGWYYYQKFTLASSVQAGVRSALSVAESDSPDPWSTAQTYAISKLSGGGIAPASITWGPAAGSRYSGVKPNRTITMTASYTFTPLVGLVPLPNKTLTYTTTMTLDAQNAQI
jgi:Flp pilus assembly protein TadG